MHDDARDGSGVPRRDDAPWAASRPGWDEPLLESRAEPYPQASEPAEHASLHDPEPGLPGRDEPRAVDPAIKEASIWLAMFSRTLKTCRLYDASNPTVSRFREELAGALDRLLAAHGTVTYRFTADDVTCEGQSVYSARSREDNLAFAFYRDGVRGLTLQPGADERELNAVIDAVLGVTGQNLDGDDLVTLLWEANLRHVEIDYIPAEGETGSAEGAATNVPEDGAGPLLPWPTSEATPGDEGGAAVPLGPNDTSPGAERSEDWALGEVTQEVEATFAELDFMAATESRRFLDEYAAERRVPPPTAALAIAHACLHTEITDDDRKELARFLPRILRAALAAGAWADAREALRLVRESNTGEWSEETFTQEVLQPVSITRTVEKLDSQGPASVSEFLALAHELGPAALDWLTLTLSESQARMTRQLVAEAIAVRAQDDPTRLSPWLNDPRWYVVRNVVHILGWIGGPPVVPLLQSAVRYPDPRVTSEVVTALQGIELRLARPVLIKAMEGADTKLFCQILQQLSAARDPAVARYVTAFLAQEKFLQRHIEERRAIYAAIASTGGDEVVTELDEAMNGGNWFDREQEVHRHAVARCLARIGTPKALQALEAGAQSRRAPVRQACVAALQSRMAA
ncbi:MAG: HEAT repeat domain-containing protein [Candidatus Eisenbacteria bacterium]